MVGLCRVAVALAVGALLAQVAAGRASIAPMPASRLAREVVVYRAGVEQARLTRPGQQDVALPCTHAPGVTETLQVQVTAQSPAAAAPSADYRQAEPAQVKQIASEGRIEKVQFVDTLRAEAAGVAGIGPLMLPDGRQASVARAFVTAGGVLCLLPADAAAARTGISVRVWGATLRMPNGADAVLVDGLRPEPPEAGKDEPPWQVTARWGGRDVLSAAKPGDYELRLPCTQVAGALELAAVRVREFRLADIQVDGHAVSAELAVTPRAMSYGLQGRAGLAPDSGMLFCFGEPTEPEFVMKTVSFPLAIAFIRTDGAITNIERLNPGDGRVAVPLMPVSYVLEMEQGWFEQHGVAAGKKAVIP